MPAFAQLDSKYPGLRQMLGIEPGAHLTVHHDFATMNDVLVWQNDPHKPPEQTVITYDMVMKARHQLEKAMYKPVVFPKLATVDFNEMVMKPGAIFELPDEAPVMVPIEEPVTST